MLFNLLFVIVENNKPISTNEPQAAEPTKVIFPLFPNFFLPEQSILLRLFPMIPPLYPFLPPRRRKSFSLGQII
jgi:hypothetical protein